MQLCLGATYSWSVYVLPLRQLTGLLQGPVQLPFSVFYFAFPATMIVTGTIMHRLGTRFCAAFGGLLFGGGWLLASLGSHHFGLTVAGIGFTSGIGAGLAYIVPIAVGIQWFPEHKGLVTGVAVAGFGGGAAIVSQIAGLLISRGFTPFQTFRVFGLAFLVIIFTAGLTMVPPPETRKQKIKELPLKEILSNQKFWLLYFAMFCGLAAGFAVNANLKELYAEATIRAGATAVSLFAIANALGRISWGFIFDKIKPPTAIQANLLSQAALLVAGISFLFHTYKGFLVFSFLAGFNYGGILVLYASSSASIWGKERVGQVYGWLFSSNIPAALAPLLAGFAYDTFGNFMVPLGMISLILIIATYLIFRNRNQLG